MVQVSRGSAKWCLLPVGLVATSVFVPLGIVVFQPSFIEEVFARRLLVQTPGPPEESRQPGELEDCSGGRMITRV